MFIKILKSYDYSLILAIFLLSTFGLIMVYSSSMITSILRYDVTSSYFFKKQSISLLLGFIMFVLVSFFPYKIFFQKKFIKLLFYVSIGSLLFVIVFGHTAGNAQSWVKLGGAAIQPAEFAKISVIIYLAALLAKKQNYMDHFSHAILPPVIFVVIIFILILLQPDFGTALIILLNAAIVILCSGIPLKSCIKLAVFTSLAAMSGLMLLFLTNKLADVFSSERISRFTGFLDPFENIADSGYQLVSSYYAISGGGITGLGLGNSVQKFGYLPESHTDFIMAVISEELGIFGVLFVIVLLGFIVLKGFAISKNCQDPFGSLLAIGISSMIGIQALVNLGAVAGLLPITGVTLPFVSYGGSSLILLFISAGVLVNISMMNTFKETNNVQKAA
ncbi:FtsW/RodA/SpoVE family cell cycle protein [Metabacillus idriensis]|uniref:FtsW/RodA/SpoVE family cell cycle protein n=1 Tax=Metabacillus idriensis TaxID=324768 RepID=UPI0017493E60|nr:FtsW/RodA/SpoVE family cell cycle protein [Metabacillus idriensis]